MDKSSQALYDTILNSRKDEDDTDNLICPMTFMTTGPALAMTCKHHLCAWWDEENEECAILVIARVMDRTEDIMLHDRNRKRYVDDT